MRSRGTSRLPVLALAVAAALAGQARGQPTTTAAASAELRGALAAAGIEPTALRIEPENLALLVGRQRCCELAHLLIVDPLRAEALAVALAGQLADPARSPHELLAELSRLSTRVVRRGLVFDPAERFRKLAQDPAARQRLLHQLGADPRAPAALAELPESLQQATGILLAAALESAEWVQRSRRQVPETVWRRIEQKLREPLKTGEQEEREERESFDADYHQQLKEATERWAGQAVMVAAQDLMLAVRAALECIRADPTLTTRRFEARFRTRLGDVILTDARQQEHTDPRPVLLLIDLGGNDRYVVAGANAGLTQPVSLALDLGGDDEYIADPQQPASFGAGLFGVGILLDQAGNDRYQAERRSQAAGVFGVGVLIDQAGDDHFRSVDESQASATAGYALLLDLGGDDRYESYRASQAFAGPYAAAALIDLAGNDVYLADDRDLRYPSPQTRQHNLSMAQGAASGWRADYLDGLSVNGGVGLLLDAGGDDEYTCGVFGQGVGYWYGAGLLVDLAGNDRYRGQWYVQGASAHFAAGVLIDRGGNDHYVAELNMSQGAGHDTGSGVLIDAGGDDVYETSTLGLGAANAAGMGVFVDRAGDDVYRVPEQGSAGWVNRAEGLRVTFRSAGIFVDLAGQDVYEGRRGQAGRPELGNGRVVHCPNADPPGGLLGCAIDR